MKLLIAVRVPLSDKLPVPLPVTITPPPEEAESVPFGTLNVVVTSVDPASTSAKLMPVKGELVSSRTLMLPGSVTVGASLIDDTKIPGLGTRSEEHTSELQSLMRISYAVF